MKKNSNLYWQLSFYTAFLFVSLAILFSGFGVIFLVISSQASLGTLGSPKHPFIFYFLAFLVFLITYVFTMFIVYLLKIRKQYKDNAQGIDTTSKYVWSSYTSVFLLTCFATLQIILFFGFTSDVHAIFILALAIQVTAIVSFVNIIYVANGLLSKE